MNKTITTHNDLAIYRLGAGATLLLFPYPHASTLRPMAEDKLATLLVGLGYQVITFDPQGAYRSNRPMQCDMAEMLACAAEALEVCGVHGATENGGNASGGGFFK